MAAPDYVPTSPTQQVRTYHSPPRRFARPAARPGEPGPGRVGGSLLGVAGPDSGYAYTLVPVIEPKLQLGTVHRDDAVAGGVGVAMKRAALFGRGPIIHDLNAGFTVYGFLDPSPAPELVALRGRLFAEVHNAHHYVELRHLVDLVPDEVLLMAHGQIAEAYGRDWSSVLGPLESAR
ncbi:MAG: hypothetical protein ACK5RL_07245 [Acidimicrobiales bacterium]